MKHLVTRRKCTAHWNCAKKHSLNHMSGVCARLQRAIELAITDPDVSRLATLYSPLRGNLQNA